MVTGLFPSDKKPLLSEKALVLLTVIGDIVLIVLSDLAAFALRFQESIVHPRPFNFLDYLRLSVFIVLGRLFFLYAFGLYYKLKSKTNFEIILAVFKATFISSLIIVAVAFYFRAFAYPRLVIMMSWALTTILCIVWRISLRSIISMLLGKDFVTSKIVIVGTDDEAQHIGLHLSRDSSVQYELLGFISPDSNYHVDPNRPPIILGSIDELPSIVKDSGINEVIIATKDLPKEKTIGILAELSLAKVDCKVMPQIYDALMGNIISTPLDSMAPVFLVPLQEKFYFYRGLKIVLDIIAAASVLLVSWPAMILVALLIKITSPGPVFFKQERVGLYGKSFIVYKFRTMYKDAEASGPVWATQDDRRVTPIGRFFRRVRLDELPQFYNVLKNEMSFVGPRPERPHFVEVLFKEIPFYLERLTVKPGITGWAQVTCPYADSVEDSKDKFIADIFYIKNMSFALDLFIVFKTLWTIIQEKGAQ